MHCTKCFRLVTQSDRETAELLIWNGLWQACTAAALQCVTCKVAGLCQVLLTFTFASQEIAFHLRHCLHSQTSVN